MTTIATALNIAVRNTMDAVASLERDGMVERSRDPYDRHAIVNSLTPNGRKTLSKSLRVSDRNMNASFTHLTPEEIAACSHSSRVRTAIVAR